MKSQQKDAEKAQGAVAIYWDFENIHAALVDALYGEGTYRRQPYQPQEPLIDVGSVVSWAQRQGGIVIHRAYANWQWMGRYRDGLLAHAMDLVQLFPLGRNAKNGADIRLSLDVLDDLRGLPHVRTVVIVGGDSDYVAVAQRARASGRRVLGVGVEGSTNRYWRGACNEFRFYKTLLAQEGGEPSEVLKALQASVDLEEVRRSLVEAVRRLASHRGGLWALRAAIKPMMTRIAPEFDEATYGYGSFGSFLEAQQDLVALRPGEVDHEVAVRADLLEAGVSEVPPAPPRPAPQSATTREYERLLRQERVYLPDRALLWPALRAVAGTFRAAHGRVASFEAVERGALEILKREHPEADEAPVRQTWRLLYRLRLFILYGRDEGLGLRANSPDALCDLVASTLVGMLVEESLPPYRAEDLHQLLFGTEQPPTAEQLSWIEGLTREALEGEEG